jgi:DNA-binding transcriptional LysR family regulator
MDTRFLETFLMAVDHGSIAEAARRLNLTAAAVAKRIHALENEIGSVLVTRSGRTIRPTEAGAAIVEHARRFLIEAHDFKSIAATDRPSGQLRVGAFQSAMSGLLPDILALMRESYPQIDVHVAGGTSSELYRKVLDGNELDLAIIAEPPFSIPKSCHWRLLREEPLVLLIKASSASRKPHAILASEPFIRLDRNVWPGRLVDGYLRKAGIQPRERFEIEGARPRRSPLWWIEGSVCQSCRTGHRRGRKVCRWLNCRYRTPLLLQGASASCGPKARYAFAWYTHSSNRQRQRADQQRKLAVRERGSIVDRAISLPFSNLAGRLAYPRAVDHTRIWHQALMTAFGMLEIHNAAVGIAV